MTSRLDKLSWKHLKRIIRDDTCFRKFVDIVNVCIDLEHWLVHFKVPTTIIILKPNKESYNSPKAFWSIILLNTIGKLFKKAISERLQFVLVLNNFIHTCQLRGLKQRSTTDMGIVLTHFICMGWVKNISTSMLAFDIVQFFPLLNYQLLLWILNKEGFDSKSLVVFSKLSSR